MRDGENGWREQDDWFGEADLAELEALPPSEAELALAAEEAEADERALFGW